MSRPEVNAALTALPGLPRDSDGPVFAEPWHAQAFAMAVELNARDIFTWSEWAETLGAEIANMGADASGENAYFSAWLKALEEPGRPCIYGLDSCIQAIPLSRFRLSNPDRARGQLSFLNRLAAAPARPDEPGSTARPEQQRRACPGRQELNSTHRNHHPANRYACSHRYRVPVVVPHPVATALGRAYGELGQRAVGGEAR